MHLIVGANPLAAARCTKSVQAGAKPVIVSPESESLQYTLASHIDNGSAGWVRKEFEDGDLTALGREEVDHVVDMVFVTLGGNHPLSMYRVQQLMPYLTNPGGRPSHIQAMPAPQDSSKCL